MFINKEFEYQKVLDREVRNFRAIDHDAPEYSRRVAGNQRLGNERAGFGDAAG